MGAVAGIRVVDDQDRTRPAAAQHGGIDHHRLLTYASQGPLDEWDASASRSIMTARPRERPVAVPEVP
jgi:hypothetical protein